MMHPGGSAALSHVEKAIVAELRLLLSKEEWSRLPEVLTQRNQPDVRAEVERREAREQIKRREEEERKQREIAHERDRRIRERVSLIEQLKVTFESHFLAADEVFAEGLNKGLVTPAEYEQLKVDFVQEWASRTLEQPPDREQTGAIATISGDLLVVARAGSGKTRTLVTRAIFLQKHCGASPRELLLLAFNKAAAQEMKERLAQVLGADLPHVMTFHALAHALVHPDEQILYDDMAADHMDLSRAVQGIIDEHVRSAEYGARIRELMLAHFREDWERIADGRFHLTMDKFLTHRRALPRESLRGEYVKSYGEKVIANALFEHGVDYRYERNFRWNEVNYRPDFTIRSGAKSDVIVEYFGLEGDADYDRMSEQKRQFWAARDETFLEFSPGDLTRNGVEGFTSFLVGRLREAGVPCRRRTEEEIWQLIKVRALDRFTGAMKQFVGRARKRNLSAEALESMAQDHSPCSTAEALFLDLGVSIYRGYLQHLQVSNEDDFDGLMWRAVSLIRDGQTGFRRDRGRERGDLGRIRFVLIDEFQDFSQVFFELIDAIRAVSPAVQFFCVGDDWQAINSFAGSDLRFFRDFEQYFKGPSRCHIRTNFRSPRSVVEMGNALMRGRGVAAIPNRADAGSVLLCRLDQFKPSAAEQARHGGDEATPALLRLIRRLLDRGLDVVMLSRRNGVPWYVNYRRPATGFSDGLARFLEHVRSFLPTEDRRRLDISTAHGYKGREQSAVIVLDAVDRSYPLIHPNWVFLRLFGDSLDRIEEEERRLFYIALTRTSDSLALLTETPNPSSYLDDIHRFSGLRDLVWDSLTPTPSLDGARLDIRVAFAFDASLNNRLKSLGYQWRPGRYWSKAVMAEGFSFDRLCKQPWLTGGMRIEVYTESGQLVHRR